MCDCQVCEEHKEFVDKLNQILDKQLRIYVDFIYSKMVAASTDRDYYRAICLGVWPDADEIIKRMRANK